jgi:PhoH-like ATPase
MKNSIVFDTSVLLAAGDRAFEGYKEYDTIVIPVVVLKEIDGHKNRLDVVGLNARQAIRVLDSIRDSLPFARYGSKNIEVNTDAYVEPLTADEQIIRVALGCGTLASCDINMRVRAAVFGIKAIDVESADQLSSAEEIYGGVKTVVVADEVLNEAHKTKVLDVVELCDGDVPFENQFVVVKGCGGSQSALMRCRGGVARMVPNKIECGELVAKNKEQAMALDLLFDPKVEVITVLGKAGSGKTLIALAAGLAQVLDIKAYDRLIVSRPVQPMGKDIGFLPGSLEDKMRPWLAPVQDNLEFLMSQNRQLLDDYLKDGTIEIEALTFIRGRSIPRAFILIDEAQNLTAHELKTILTRVGQGSKIVLTGDIEQIDNVYINSTTNGLTHCVERFKTHACAGHITLRKGERSAVATLAAEIL